MPPPYPDAVTGAGIDERQLQQLLDAIVSVGSELDLPSMLRRIVQATAELVDARYVALGVLDPERTSLTEFITVGIDDDTIAAIGPFPQGEGVLGRLIVDPRPLRLDDVRQHADSVGFPENHPVMTTFLGVPVPVHGQAFGNLYLCDKRDGTPFSAVDEQLVVGLAAAAGVAVEHTRLNERIAEFEVLADRERIARDLHDVVIQRIFATGLALQSVAARETDADLADRMQRCVDDLDETVRHIRTTIFELQESRLPGRSVRQDILDLAAEAAEPLGFEPSVRFDGPIDLTLPDDVADHLLSSLREALANIVKHANAHSADIVVGVGGGNVRLVVHDDGVGLPDELRAEGQGIKNLRARAEQLGGRMTIDRREGDRGGTALEWTVPLGS